MPYQQGYVPGDYGGYQGYGQTHQTHGYQVNQNQQFVSNQPRRDVSQLQASPSLPSYPQYQAGFYQQYPSQYEQATRQQYYFPQSQAQYSQTVQRQQQPVQFQSQPIPTNYQRPSHQASYQQQPAIVDPHQVYRGGHNSHRPPPSPHVQYQQTPRQPSQTSPQLASSPDPLHAPQYQIHSQSFSTESQSRQQGPRPAQQSHNQSRAFSNVHEPQITPHQRVVARVEIPLHRVDTKPPQPEMERPPKKRRSNEGHPVPICEVPAPLKTSSQQSRSQGPAVSSPLTELTSSQLPPTPKPNVDYQIVLLALADEYIAAAHSISASLSASDGEDEKEEEYHKLMATGMGCLESVITNYRQPDVRMDARLRLRLASLMIEETENYEEAEEILSKGIALCERSRLLDLKYAMHYVLTRVTLKSSPKAALKSIDKLVQEVEALSLVPWIYAFRFLRVSLSLEVGSHTDTSAILKHLTAIVTMAEEQRDVAVQISAAILEAMIHIRSGSSDAVELAQRAMAAARTHQLGADMQRMPHARVLLDCLDLSCCLMQFTPDQVIEKMQRMQNNLDSSTREDSWESDGTMLVEFNQSSSDNLERDTGGILVRSKNGNVALVLKWITKSQIWALGFILSGLASMCKNGGDNQSEKFLNEGLKVTKLPPEKVSRSLMAATESIEKQTFMGIAMRLLLIFVYCGRYEWRAARKMIQGLRKEYSQRGQDIDQSTARTLLYLEALCRQGLGDLQGALKLYDSPSLTFEPESKASIAEKDLRALATLNGIFILRALGVEDFVKAEKTLSAVEPYCQQHSNKSMKAVIFIVKATAQGPNNAIIKTKSYIQSAVQASQAASNSQLLTIVMNMMTSTFFTNIVGGQAEKSARAARQLAKKTRDRLWTAVADGMYADIRERCGEGADAESVRTEARSLLNDLPESLKSSLQM